MMIAAVSITSNIDIRCRVMLDDYFLLQWFDFRSRLSLCIWEKLATRTCFSLLLFFFFSILHLLYSLKNTKCNIYSIIVIRIGRD